MTNALDSSRVLRVGSLLALVAVLSGCGGSDDALLSPASFRRLGVLPGFVSSTAVAVSTDGAVVTGTLTAASGLQQAFRWTVQGGMVALGVMPGASSTTVTAMSSDGSVIVGNGDDPSSSPPTPSAALRWTATTGWQRIPSLPGAYLCAVGGVSGDGTAAAGTCLTINNAAYRWSAAAGSVALGQFGGGSNRQSSAGAISLDGQVVAGAGHPSLTGAVVWAADGTATVIGQLNGSSSARATALSRDGGVVAGAAQDGAGNDHAFRWTSAGGTEALERGSEGLLGSSAASVSGDGALIVGRAQTATGDAALIWDAAHGLRPLDAALMADHGTHIEGWTLNAANGIADGGRFIVGVGSNPHGQAEAWLIALPN